MTAGGTGPAASGRDADGMDIVLRDVCVSYGQRLALDGISFTVPRGGFWGIIGPNGSGKTTLVRTILGLLPVQSGTLEILGRPPQQLRERRALIGYVPQFAAVDFTFPLLVRDVVAMGLYGKLGRFRRPPRRDDEAVRRALELVDMSALAERHIGALSGGQRQRVLIARALVVEPRLLILDEPTTALDATGAESFYDWLQRLQEQQRITTLLVSHDIGVVSRHVHAIACLNTRLVAHGRPADILTMDTMEAMYGCGAVMFDHGRIPHMVVDETQHARHTHADDGAGHPGAGHTHPHAGGE